MKSICNNRINNSPVLHKISKCCLCLTYEDSEDKYGILLTSSRKNLVAHEYCLTFSAGLSNQKDEKLGLNGFLENEIENEIRRGNRLTCKLCNKLGATLGCHIPRCKNVYHFPCALVSKCLLQYYGAFNMYCPIHRLLQNSVNHINRVLNSDSTVLICHKDYGFEQLAEKSSHSVVFLSGWSLSRIYPSLTRNEKIQVLPNNTNNISCSCLNHNLIVNTIEISSYIFQVLVLYPFVEKLKSTCRICFCEINGVTSFDVLVTPCCTKHFHRICIQKMALCAGKHHLKCPICSSEDVFRIEMLKFGINLPDRDALWEYGQNYDDLQNVFESCLADNCFCPYGRDFNGEQNFFKDKSLKQWIILLCSSCGQFGIHKTCLWNNSPDRKHNDYNIKWTCPSCKGTEILKDNRLINSHFEELTNISKKHLRVNVIKLKVKF